jgi:hypothetical protein
MKIIATLRSLGMGSERSSTRMGDQAPGLSLLPLTMDAECWFFVHLFTMHS